MVTTNPVEGYFSILKRGMEGIFEHCGERPLHRNLAEFDFRYRNWQSIGANDADHTVHAPEDIMGEHLTFQTAGCG